MQRVNRTEKADKLLYSSYLPERESQDSGSLNNSHQSLLSSLSLSLSSSETLTLAYLATLEPRFFAALTVSLLLLYPPRERVDEATFLTGMALVIERVFLAILEVVVVVVDAFFMAERFALPAGRFVFIEPGRYFSLRRL